MHAFDDAKLQGSIDVRFMKPGESIKLLNDQEVEYRAEPARHRRCERPGGLGRRDGRPRHDGGRRDDRRVLRSGVLPSRGGPGQVARAAAHERRGPSITNAASIRKACAAALDRATALTLEICGGKAGPVTRAEGTLPARSPIVVRPARVRALLGYAVDEAEMHIDPRSARMPSRGRRRRHSRDTALVALRPRHRGRLRRGDRAHPRLRPRARSRAALRASRCSRCARGAATASTCATRWRRCGYQEVINYSFVSEDWERDFAGNDTPVRLANPISSQMGVMRTTLMGGLVQTLRSNLNRGEDRVRDLRDRPMLRGLRARRGGAARAHRGARLSGPAGRSSGPRRAPPSISSTQRAISRPSRADAASISRLRPIRPSTRGAAPW